MQGEAVRTIRALVIGAIGGVAAWLVGLPAPMLMGPAISVTIAAVAGQRMHMPVWLRDSAFVIIGIGMGAGVTPETLQAVRTWPASIAFLIVVVAAILVAGAAAVAWLFGKDWRTSVLAASPGHLSYVLGLGVEMRADIGFVTVVQSLRLLALTLLVPVVVVMGGQVGTPSLPVAPLALIPLALCILASGVSGMILARLGVPAALLLGGMFVSSFAHGIGLIHGGVPGWLALPAFGVMWTLIGTSFDGARWAVLRAALGASVVLTSLSVGIAIIGAFMVAWLTDLPTMQVLIAFAPGGVETMAAMAVLLDADPAFVAAHHVLRLFVLTALVPLALRLR